MAEVKRWGEKQKREHASRLAKAEMRVHTSAEEEGKAEVRLKLAEEDQTRARRRAIEAIHARDRVEVEPIIARLPPELRSHLTDRRKGCSGDSTCAGCQALARRSLAKRETFRGFRATTIAYSLNATGRKVRDALFHIENQEEVIDAKHHD